MSEFAARGHQRQPARARARGPEPARERSPEGREQETKRREAAVERTLVQVRAAITEARSAFGERDVEGFDDAQKQARSRLTQAQIYVLSLRENVRDAGGGDAKERLDEIESEVKERKREIDRLVRPEPLPEPFANEELILSSIPSGRVENAHAVFAATEARLVGLLKGLPAKDRGIFLARIKKVDDADPIATRWRRLGPERRQRILRAVRSVRPLKEAEPARLEMPWDGLVQGAAEQVESLRSGWRDLMQPEEQVPDEHERVEFEIGNVDADEWLFTNRDSLEDRVLRLMRSATYALAHPRLAWADSAFADLLAADLLDGLFLERLTAVLPQTDLGALADGFRPLAEPPTSRGAEDEAGETKESEKIAAPVGPRTWEPDFAIAVVRKLDAQVRASLHRLEPRIVAAADAEWKGDDLTQDGFDPGSLVFSHPIDRLVANAMASFGTLIISRADEGAELDASVASKNELRPVQFRWLEERQMWNWIEVEPADASVEEVSQSLFGTTEKAFLLSASNPFFEVPVEQATKLAPHRRLAIEARNLLTGQAGGGAIGVDALASSDVAETAALAQASRGAEGLGQDASSIDGDRMAAVCQVQLESLAERFGALGVDADLSQVIARLDGRRAALATEGAPQAAKLGLLFAGQRAILLRVATLLEKLGSAGASVTTNDTAKHLAERLGAVASVSDFTESARARLADIAAEAGALPNEIATRLLNEAMARFGGLEQVLKATSTPIKLMHEEVEFGDLRGQYDKLRERALKVERRQASGTLGPDEQRQLLDDVEFFEARVRTIHQVTQLTHTMEGLSGTGGWAASIVGIHDDLEDDHVELRLLREDIVRRFRDFAEERAMHMRKLADPNWKPDPRTEYETTAAAVAEFKGGLAALGADAKIKAKIQRAYDTLDDASGRLALLEFAKFIGITLVTSGAGAVATGVARGFQVSRLAVAGAGVATEAAVSGALIAASGDGEFGETFATEMVTGMAFFGAFKAFEQFWAASQVGRNAAAMKASGGINKAAAVGFEFSAQGAFAVGVQTATAEAQMQISEGRWMTSDERAQVVAQGTAMHIGSSIAHKVAGPMMERLSKLGAGASANVRSAARLRRMARKVQKSGDLAQTLELVRVAREVAADEMAFLQKRANGEASTSGQDAAADEVHQGSLTKLREDYARLGVDAVAADGRLSMADADPAFFDMAVDAIARQSGLDQAGVDSFVGDAAQVNRIVAQARQAGLAVKHRLTEGGRVVVRVGGGDREIDISLISVKRSAEAEGGVEAAKGGKATSEASGKARAGDQARVGVERDGPMLVARLEAGVAAGKAPLTIDLTALRRQLDLGHLEQADLSPELLARIPDQTGVNLHDHLLGVPESQYFIDKAGTQIGDDPVKIIEDFVDRTKKDEKILGDMQGTSEAWTLLQDGLTKAKAEPDPVEARRVAQAALEASLKAGEVSFDQTYSTRDSFLKLYVGSGAEGNVEFVADLFRLMRKQGMSYSEQSVSLSKARNRFGPDVMKKAAALAGVEGEGVEIRFLAMFHTKNFTDDSPEQIARFEKDKAAFAKLLESRDDIMGIDVAGPESDVFTDAGRKRMRELYDMVKDIAAERGRSLVFRPHVGEGFVKAGTDHVAIARENIDKVIDGLQGINPAEDGVIVRFGHLTHASPEQLQRVKNLGVIVEANIGSNVSTRTIGSEEDHPILQMLYEQNEVILNTDGGGVMKTKLDGEYQTVQRAIARFKKPKSELTIKVNGKAKGYRELSPAEQRRFDIQHVQKAASRYEERIRRDKESRNQGEGV